MLSPAPPAWPADFGKCERISRTAGRGATERGQNVISRTVRAIMDGLGFEVDTTDEAREILQLKGGYKVAF
jgi:hypothetical protein